jgi:hypothetical protein
MGLDVTDLNVIPLRVSEFRKNNCKEGSIFLMKVIEIIFMHIVWKCRAFCKYYVTNYAFY